MKRREEREEERGREKVVEYFGLGRGGRGEGRERSSSRISYHLGLDLLGAGVKMVV